MEHPEHLAPEEEEQDQHQDHHSEQRERTRSMSVEHLDELFQRSQEEERAAFAGRVTFPEIAMYHQQLKDLVIHTDDPIFQLTNPVDLQTAFDKLKSAKDVLQDRAYVYRDVLPTVLQSYVPPTGECTRSRRPTSSSRQSIVSFHHIIADAWLQWWEHEGGKKLWREAEKIQPPVLGGQQPTARTHPTTARKRQARAGFKCGTCEACTAGRRVCKFKLVACKQSGCPCVNGRACPTPVRTERGSQRQQPVEPRKTTKELEEECRQQRERDRRERAAKAAEARDRAARKRPVDESMRSRDTVSRETKRPRRYDGYDVCDEDDV